MKSNRILLSLLALGTLAFPASAQIRSMVGGEVNGLIERPELYDGLMIATALGPPVGHPLPGRASLAVQRVRVEDSRAFATGTVVDVYFLTPGGSMVTVTDLSKLYPGPPRLGVPIDPTGSIPVGTRVLLVGRVARDGLLRSTSPTPSDPAPFPLDSSGPAMMGEAFFLTTRSRLAATADPEWRFLGSLAEAIPGTGDANARDIVAAVDQGPSGDQTFVYGRPDDRFSLLFSGAVANDTAYHRALVDHMLNGLRYWGYGDKFRQDLRLAIDDEGAFPDGIPPLAFEEDPGSGNNNSLPKDFKHDPPLTQAQILALLTRAESTTIAAGLVHGLSVKPTDTEVKALARFLNSPDPRLRRAFVERLVAWYGGDAPEEPREVKGADLEYHWEFPGLDAAVAFWKAKLGTP